MINDNYVLVYTQTYTVYKHLHDEQFWESENEYDLNHIQYIDSHTNRLLEDLNVKKYKEAKLFVDTKEETHLQDDLSLVKVRFYVKFNTDIDAFAFRLKHGY